jgi:glycosyltransferase involved in cell wall biosynthesis
MRIVYITAGAAGMFCGSCMRDNTLVAALTKAGHEALLVPTYTPIRTDEVDVSQKRVFFGGINVYLEQKLALFRHTPWFVDRLLNFPAMLRWVSRFAVRTQAADLGDLTVSMLQGGSGKQRKEVDKIARWLGDEIRPEVINLTNALLSGMVPGLKARLPGVPILCSLQGDDIYTESLPEPFRGEVLALIRQHAKLIDGFIATSASYADFMAGYFDIPRDRIHVVYPGLNLAGQGGPRPDRTAEPFTVGYFARICPEKGFHQLVDAFLALRKLPGTEGVRLRASGWLGENQRPFYAEQVARLDKAGLLGDFTHVESPTHDDKVRFFHEIDVLSVPTTYHEPKGLYVLEALAHGVPVVQPRHGSFPELVEMTGGGLLTTPGDADDLAAALHRLMHDRELCARLAQAGKAAVHERFHAARMAEETATIYQGITEQFGRG